MSLFSQIRYQDILDIAICSYILFRFYVLFRGTNVFTVLIAIASLWILQILSVWTGLIVTSYAIQAITALAAIIIIVIFRNEIRRTLQAANLKTLLWGFPRAIINTPTAVITESVFDLARHRIGGLIVLPGKEDLRDYMHSGISFEGLVSHETIASIFWKDNPIHDGAIVISGDRIVQVRTILPLTKRKDLPSYFGTRHRAATGLAEMSDALVIVVSEERGHVLVVKGNQSLIVKQNADLLRMLEEHTGVREKKGGLFRNEKARFGFAAFVSVVFISGAWLNLTKGLDTLITLQIPVEYRNRNPELEITGTGADSVRIFLKGSEALLESIRPERLKVNINLDSAVKGKNLFEISDGNITLPPGITLKNVQPPLVAVTLDVQSEKELPIQVDWIGKLSTGLILERVSIDPENVNVRGASLVLQDTATIYTEAVRLDPLEESGSRIVDLVLMPPSLQIESGYPNTVSISYTIGKREF